MSFEVVLEGFSGPLDLLCSLVESRAILPSQIRIVDVVHLYAAYLARREAMTIRELAEFLALAARLLLGKVQALLPSLAPEEISEDELLSEDPSPEELEAALARYRPYRRAAALLGERFVRRSASFGRPSEEEPPYYDLGDVYALAALWWARVAAKRAVAADEDDDPFGEEGFPEEISDEERVESRMAELRSVLALRGGMRLTDVLNGSSRPQIVLTILALLEMARLGEVRLKQEELFGDVHIVAPVAA